MLLHRVLLCFGDYSKKISEYGSDDYLLSFYCSDSKHHKDDWRGMLRDNDGFNIFKRMYDSFKTGDFTKFAREQIKSYLKSGSNNTDSLRTLLIENPELFKYIRSYCRIQYLEEGAYKSWNLLPASRRGRHINYKLFAVLKTINKDSTDFHEAVSVSNSGSQDISEEYIVVNGKEYRLKKTSSDSFCFCDKNGNDLRDPAITTVDDMINYLNTLK